MMWILFDNLILICETGLLFFLAYHFLAERRKGTLYVITYMTLFLVLHKIIAILFAGHVGLTALCIDLVDYVLFGILWPKQWGKRLFIICSYHVLMLSLDLLLIFTIPVEIAGGHLEEYQFFGMIASRLLLFLAVLIIVRLGYKKASAGNHFIFAAPIPALLVITLLCSLCGYEVYEVMFHQRLEITVTIIVLTVLVLLFSYAQLNHSEEILQERLQAQQQLQREQERYTEAVMKNYAAVRQSRHDLKHHMGTISTLIQDGNYALALQTCSSVEQRIGTSLIYTGNEMIDAILYSKQVLFQKAEVMLIVEGCLPGQLEYDGADLCVILSNALENAVEAVKALPQSQRYVTVSFIYNGWLLIRVENEITSIPRKYNGRYHSGKIGKEHGIGLSSIETACERQNGYFEIILKDGKFLLAVTLQPGNHEE